MRVAVLAAEAEFRALLVFLLEYHGLEVVAPAPHIPLASTSARSTAPTVLLVALTEEAATPALVAAAMPYRERCPLLVLTRPGTGLATAARVLPWAAATLPVPLVPHDLLARLRTLGQAAPQTAAQRPARAACP
jgi:DNA-binding response OmpR family regulator